MVSELRRMGLGPEVWRVFPGFQILVSLHLREDKHQVGSSLCLATCDFTNRHPVSDSSPSVQTDPVDANIARRSVP